MNTHIKRTASCKAVRLRIKRSRKLTCRINLTSGLPWLKFHTHLIGPTTNSSTARVKVLKSHRLRTNQNTTIGHIEQLMFQSLRIYQLLNLTSNHSSELSVLVPLSWYSLISNTYNFKKLIITCYISLILKQNNTNRVFFFYLSTYANPRVDFTVSETYFIFQFIGSCRRCSVQKMAN